MMDACRGEVMIKLELVVSPAWQELQVWRGAAASHCRQHD